MRYSTLFAVLAALLVSTADIVCADVTVVENGQAKISGIYIAKLDQTSPLLLAAQDLAVAIEKMSGANIEVKEVTGAKDIPSGAAIVLGQPAAELGAAPKAQTPWKDTVRTVIKNGRILVAGESAMAENNGVMELLHEQGVRYFLPSNLPGDIGTVMPHKSTLRWIDRDEERHPFIRTRRVWGHNMGQIEKGGDWQTAWIRRTQGFSPVQIDASHAWARLIPKDRQKPEYYAVKRYDENGQPVRGGQFNVGNSEVAPLVAQTLIDRFRADPNLRAQSISPNDGGGADISPESQRLDTPGYLEPTSGNVVLSDRYLAFFNRVAEIVSKEFPDRYLAFLVYSDYSRPPKKIDHLHPMLVPIFAPIRYPRMQSMFNLNSEQNIRQRHAIEKYVAMSKQFGYYGYNYNLAEATVPFSKISIYSQELPWLAKLGMLNATMETLGNWNTNGPHIYLASRYIASGEEPSKIMDDYFEKLGGAAAKELRAYWGDVDTAFRQASVQSGSFFGIETILTPEVLARLQAHLAAATRAAQTERERGVVAFFQSGLDQGKLALETINDLNNLQLPAAKAAYDKLHALNTQLEAQNVVSKYPNAYTKAYLAPPVESGAALIEAGGKIAVKFPNTALFRTDLYDVGVEEEWFDPAHGDERWLPVKTWGAPSLYSQGLGDVLAYQWFKIEADVPAENADKMMLWFGSNDGSTCLWVNGRPVPFRLTGIDGKTKAVKVEETYEYPKAWRAFSVPVGKYLKPGAKNTFVMRIDHSSLNDLNLGGILRPIMLYVPGAKEMQEVEDTYERMLM
jgi:hypothetical protein